MSDDALTAEDRAMIAAFHAEREQNPDLMPYIGPEDTLTRFLAGEIVTAAGLVTDQSPFVARNLDPRQHRRLQWMLENAAGRVGEDQP
jgi:hypothetical protein